MFLIMKKDEYLLAKKKDEYVVGIYNFKHTYIIGYWNPILSSINIILMVVTSIYTFVYYNLYPFSFYLDVCVYS